MVLAARGDPRRTLTLLWRPSASGPPRPGPKQALTVDGIVDEAIELADAEGMAALSMRAVGRRLGRTGMALYTYVPSKHELVDLMYDRAHAALPDSYDTAGGWRAAAVAWARDLWRCYQAHPWLLEVSHARPVMGPREYTVVEAVTRILYETGLPARLLARVVGTLFHFVRGAASAIVEADQAVAATGTSNEDWWAERSAALLEVVPDFADRYPTIVRLGTEDTFEWDESRPYLEQQATETFEVGLSVILDGLEARVPHSEPASPPLRTRESPGPGGTART